MEKTQRTEPYGICRLGYIYNLKNEGYVKELQDFLSGTDQVPSASELRTRIDNAGILLLNQHGYEKDGAGRAISSNHVRFKAFDTGYKVNGVEVYGWSEKDDANDDFKGVFWGTLEQLRAYAYLKNKKKFLFKMGDFCFDNFDACQHFLEDLNKAIMPESWSYKSKKSSFNYPILKSYLENVLLKVKKENKVLRSADKKYIIFNTNLLDKFFHSVYIIAEVEEANGIEAYFNPKRVAEESYTILRKYGFEDAKPEPPSFFSDINEVVFHPQWRIEKDYDSLIHITEERIERFPKELQDRDVSFLAKKLYEGIDYALKMAQRNYKYIVPIYYPKFDTITFLMPIFLDGTYSDVPDFALVLSTDTKNETYIARTILDLESGYQDARLIAKPDESWLNPAVMK